MYRTIVVPLDGSDLAERALPYAGLFTRRPDARLVLVRIVPASQVGDLLDTESRERLLTEARNYLTSLAPGADEGMFASAVTYYGEPGPLIVAEAVARQADLIIMSTHGRSGWGQWIYGSVAGTVLHDSSVPVLFVSPRCQPPRVPMSGARVLVPLDGSSMSRAVDQSAIDLARTLDGEIRLIRVVGPSTFTRLDGVPDFTGMPIELTEVPEATGVLDLIAQDYRSQGVAVSVEVVQSQDPVEGILEAARTWNADLVSMATHGHGGLARLVMGSVTQGVIQKANLPVLALRPAPLAEPLPTATRNVITA